MRMEITGYYRKCSKWLRRPLNTPHNLEGIPAKHAQVRQSKSKQPNSLSRFGELKQCELCSFWVPPQTLSSEILEATMQY
jgi:hypothetical protein